MHTAKQFFNYLIFAFNKKQELAIAVFSRQLSRKNYAIGFTFQSTSKDFIN